MAGLLKLSPVLFCLLAGWASAEPSGWIGRDQWNSQAQAMPETMRHTPRRIVLHHSGVLWKEGDDAFQKIKALQGWGQRDKNWPDLPYHFLIDPSGRIFEGRDLNYRPESNTSYDLDGVVNVELWGNFDEQPVTPQALKATANLLAWLGQEYGLREMSTHRLEAPGQTNCPGKDFMRYFESGQLQKMIDESND